MLCVPFRGIARPALHAACPLAVSFPGLLAVAWLLTISNPARGEIATFTVSLDGPCAGTNSAATGTGTLTLDTETGEVLYDIVLTGITPAEFHMHGPADVCTTARFAPAVIVLPNKTEASGSYTIPQAHVEAMLLAKHWIMAHTQTFPAGEILGPILPDCPSDCSGQGTCDAGECTCDLGWTGDDCSIEIVIPTLSQWGLAVMTAMLAVIGGLTVSKRARTAS